MRAIRASSAMRSWLVDEESLTAKLIAHCGQFRVRRLRQGLGLCLRDECETLGLARTVKVREREVLLLCRDVPVVYAHTVMPMRATASDWPFFVGLGERSLGSTLFGDPRVKRGALQFARLHARHPLALRARRASGRPEDSGPLYARRRIFMRKRGLLLVTEIFLPALNAVERIAQ